MQLAVAAESKGRITSFI